MAKQPITILMFCIQLYPESILGVTITFHYASLPEQALKNTRYDLDHDENGLHYEKYPINSDVLWLKGFQPATELCNAIYPYKMSSNRCFF